MLLDLQSVKFGLIGRLAIIGIRSNGWAGSRAKRTICFLLRIDKRELFDFSGTASWEAVNKAFGTCAEYYPDDSTESMIVIFERTVAGEIRDSKKVVRATSRKLFKAYERALERQLDECVKISAQN